MGILEKLFNITSNTNDKDNLTDEERNVVKNSDYEPYNFEEEDLEDDDYYYEDER